MWALHDNLYQQKDEVLDREGNCFLNYISEQAQQLAEREGQSFKDEEQNSLQLMVGAYKRIESLEEENKALKIEVKNLVKNHKEIESYLELVLQDNEKIYNEKQRLVATVDGLKDKIRQIERLMEVKVGRKQQVNDKQKYQYNNEHSDEYNSKYNSKYNKEQNSKHNKEFNKRNSSQQPYLCKQKILSLVNEQLGFKARPYRIQSFLQNQYDHASQSPFSQQFTHTELYNTQSLNHVLSGGQSREPNKEVMSYLKKGKSRRDQVKNCYNMGVRNNPTRHSYSHSDLSTQASNFNSNSNESESNMKAKFLQNNNIFAYEKRKTQRT